MDDKAGTAFTVRDNPELHRFEIDLGDSTAIAAYNLLSSAIMFTHTEVPEEHEGKGVGTALIKAALASARERHLQVMPVCAFFASYMKRHPEEQDLLAPQYRSMLGLD